MGTPEFAIPILERLHEQEEVVLVVTQQDARKGRGKKLHPSPIKKKALELGLEVFTPEDVNSLSSYERLQKAQGDLFVVAAYGQILTKGILDLPSRYSINVHGSLLPHYRGAAPIERAILAGEETTGITIMKMAEGLDAGDMALKKEIAIDEKNAGQLRTELSEIGGELLMEFIELMKNDQESFTAQNEKEATYAEKITKTDFPLLFEKENTKELVNHIRALSPDYGARINYKGKMLKIFDGKGLCENSQKEPGTIIRSKNQLIIKTLDGALEVLEIQAPGKRKMKIKDFLLGNQLQENTKIGD